MADVSNKTVLILVVLAVVVSTLGTFTVVRTANQYDVAGDDVDAGDTGATGSDSGKVRIDVSDSSEVPETTGQVLLSIRSPHDD